MNESVSNFTLETIEYLAAGYLGRKRPEDVSTHKVNYVSIVVPEPVEIHGHDIYGACESNSGLVSYSIAAYANIAPAEERQTTVVCGPREVEARIFRWHIRKYARVVVVTREKTGDEEYYTAHVYLPL